MSKSRIVNTERNNLIDIAIEYDRRMIRAIGQYKVQLFQYHYAKLHAIISLDTTIKQYCPGLVKLRKFMNDVAHSRLYKRSSRNGFSIRSEELQYAD